MPTYIDDYLDSLGSISTVRPRRRRQQEQQNQYDLTPEQQTSLLGRIGSGTIGAVSGAANVLDLPGSSVRDVIGLLGGGSFEKYNPFDQWLDPFGREAADNRVYGRDLLRGGGLVGKKDNWGNFFGGLAVDIATDPLTFWTGGTAAVGPMGRAAKAAGMFGDIAEIATKKLAREAPDLARRVGPREARLTLTGNDVLTTGERAVDGSFTPGAASNVAIRRGAEEIAAKRAAKTGRVLDEDLISEVMGENLGGLGRWRVPFTDIEAIVGTGPKSQVVARGMDIMGNAIRQSGPVRTAAGLFGRTGGALTELGQKAFGKISDKQDALNQQGMSELAPLFGDEELRTHFDYDAVRKSLPNADVLKGEDLIRATNETINNRHFETVSYLEGIKRAEDLDPNLVPPSMIPKLDAMKNIVQRQYTAEHETIGTESLSDIFSAYFPRARNYLTTGQIKSKSRPVYDVSHGYQEPRTEFLKNMRVGTAVIQKLSVDLNVSGYAWRYGQRRGKTGIMERFDDFLHGTAAEQPEWLNAPKLEGKELDNLVAYVKSEYGDQLRMPHPTKQGEFIGPDDSQIREMTRWLTGLDVKHSQLQIPAFEVNPLAALKGRVEFGNRAVATFDGATDAIADAVLPVSKLEPGHGRTVNDVLDIMYKGNVPDGARASLLEKLAGSRTAEALEPAQREVADAVNAVRQEASVKAAIDHDELLEKFDPKFDVLNEEVGKVFTTLGRKQEVLKRFEAADRMTPTLESLDDDLFKSANQLDEDLLRDPIKAYQTVQAWDDILAAAEEVKPAAIAKDVMAELADKIKTIRGPLEEYHAKLKGAKGDPVVIDRINKKWDETASNIQVIEKARAGIKGGKLSPNDVTRQNAASVAQKNDLIAQRDAAIEAAGNDKVKIRDIERGYQRLLDAVQIIPVERAADVSPSITATIVKAINSVKAEVRQELKTSTIENARRDLEKLSERIGTAAAKVTDLAATRARKKFGLEDLAEDLNDIDLSPSMATARQLQDTVNGSAFNANSLEELDLAELQTAFSETLGGLRTGMREGIARSSQESVEAAAKKAAATSDKDVLAKVFIPEKVADDIVKFTSSITKPEALRGFEDWIDRFIGHWKTHMTVDWPAFHSRNYVSGQAYNFMSGAWSYASHAASWSLLRGKEAKGLQKIRGFKNMTDAQASKQIREELFALDVANHEHGMHFVPELARRQTGLVGQSPVFRSAPIDTTLAQRLNPLNLEAYTLHRVGQDAARFVEGLNRITPYIELRKKGWTPAAAAKRVNEIQVDYKNSAVADKLMTRLFPFWKFSKGIVPFTLKELAQKPGGGIAQTIRAVNRGRKTDETTPDYVADTAALGLGALPDGSQRYITGLGMPFEDVFSLLNPANPKGSGLEVLSRLNPLIKAPLEAITGQSFFQKGPLGGRPLEDMDPTIGRTISNIGQLAQDPKRILFGGEPVSVDPAKTSRELEFILANSPLSRATTTARSLSDPRKGLGAKAMNVFTGFKVSDVSPAAQDAILQEATAKAMKRLGGKSFVNTYIPQDRRERLSEEDQADAILLSSLSRELVRRRKERKAKLVKSK